MHSPRVYFNKICTYCLRHGKGLSALLILKLTRQKHAPWKAGRTLAAKFKAKGFLVLMNDVLICGHLDNPVIKLWLDGPQ